MLANAAHDDGGDRYAYRASLVGGGRSFRLDDDGLRWQEGAREFFWRYADIVGIRLSYRPTSMQARRFRADLRHASGARLSILSTSWQTVSLAAPQDAAYSRFIRRLHQRLAQAHRGGAGRAGLQPALYALAAILVALVSCGLLVMAVRAVMTGEWPGLAFVAAFAALFVWQIGGFMRRNRPRAYALDSPPQDLLP